MEIYLFLPERRRLGALDAIARRYQLQVIEGRFAVRAHFAGRFGLLLLLIDEASGPPDHLTPGLRAFLEEARGALDSLEFIWGEIIEDEAAGDLRTLRGPLQRGCCYTLQR